MTSSPSARGLLLDVGVVLFKSAWELADDYERVCGLEPGTIEGRGPFGGDDPMWDRYRAGEVNEREYWLTFADRAVERGAPLMGHPTLMRSLFQHPEIDGVRPEARALIEACREEGIPLGILTNELMDFQGREWVEAQDWYPLFGVLVDSTELSVRKPDPTPYLVAIEQMGIPAGELVFIDDNPTYVQGGLDVGMPSILLDVLDPAAAFDEAARRLGLAR